MLQRISEPLRNQGEYLGNKGKFLCVMNQAGFCVPDGVILDGEEYKKFIKKMGYRVWVIKLCSFSLTSLLAVGVRIYEQTVNKQLQEQRGYEQKMNKISQKSFNKTIDKQEEVWYNIYNKEREEQTMNWLEIAVLYTEYLMDCEEKGIEPLDEKEWYKKFEEEE